ncbi:F-box only protein 33-like [Limulus polyphemus]|uniref:F-box only protein 33-like n=1 Tax=Limulus polyphemus TaxID=6850 RepID=A0ABM1B9W7_LIMPO|nr:F-box only protein 33-like [Limulus polyphemus]
MAAVVRHRFWNDLPTVVITEILSYLSFGDRLRCSLVCKSWRQCLFSSQFWKNVVFVINNGNTPSTLQVLWSNNRARSRFFHKVLKCCKNSVRNVQVRFNSLNGEDVLQALEITETLVTLRSKLQGFSLEPSSSHIEWNCRSSCKRKNEEDLNFTNKLGDHMQKGVHQNVSQAKTEDKRNFQDRFIKAIRTLMMQDNHLKHIGFGFIEELVEDGNSYLTLLSQHQAESIQSLHLASVQETMYEKSKIVYQANLFHCLIHLTILSIDFDQVTDALLTALADQNRLPLKQLLLYLSNLNPHYQPVSVKTWMTLTKQSPSLEVTVTLLHFNDESSVLSEILSSHMPLTHFRSFFSAGIDEDLLYQLAVSNSETLQSLYIMDSLSEEKGPSVSFLVVDEDPFVILAWKCKKLTSLTIIGFEVADLNVIAFARLRGSNLKELKIPACCIVVGDDGKDVVYLDQVAPNKYHTLVNEVSKSLQFQWKPLSTFELHPSVINVELDAEEAYLWYILKDQRWLDVVD